LVFTLATLPFGHAAAAESATADTPTILVFGDSLSAAYRIPRDQGWVALLQQRLRQQALPQQVVNASVSGETTSGGWSRLPAALKQHKPDIVVLELGANDGLRGLPVADMQRNLEAMIKASRDAGARVLLVGMLIPPNYGPRYTHAFAASFKELAERYDLPLLPFLLEGVAGKRALTQDDGLHPTAGAQEKILDNVWEVLQPMLKKS
jgi:acyl-CoA thioesterase-1